MSIREDLDRQIDAIEHVLLMHPHEPDDDLAPVWYGLGLDAAEVRRWLDAGVVCPKTAAVLLGVGLNIDLLETKRTQVTP